MGLIVNKTEVVGYPLYLAIVEHWGRIAAKVFSRTDFNPFLPEE